MAENYIGLIERAKEHFGELLEQQLARVGV